MSQKKIKEIDYIQVKNSYLGHLCHGNTGKFTYLELNKYKKDLSNIGIFVKIINGNIVYIYSLRTNYKLIKKIYIFCNK